MGTGRRGEEGKKKRRMEDPSRESERERKRENHIHLRLVTSDIAFILDFRFLSRREALFDFSASRGGKEKRTRYRLDPLLYPEVHERVRVGDGNAHVC